MDVLEHPNAFLHPIHALDYLNVVEAWVRKYDSPHQVKAIFMAARFMNDTIRSNAMISRWMRTFEPLVERLWTWRDNATMASLAEVFGKWMAVSNALSPEHGARIRTSLQHPAWARLPAFSVA